MEELFTHLEWWLKVYQAGVFVCVPASVVGLGIMAECGHQQASRIVPIHPLTFWSVCQPIHFSANHGYYLHDGLKGVSDILDDLIVTGANDA